VFTNVIIKLYKMKNYNYLSPKEQHIFNQIAEYKKIFTINDLYNLTGEKLYNLLLSLKKKGYILRLKRGFYVIKRAFIEDSYRIAAELEKGVIGFISALKLHRLIDYEPNSIFILTESKSNKIKILNHTINYINLKQKWGIKKINNVFATDIEKTIIDSIFKPEFSGGYPVIAKAIYDAEINWKRLIKYLDKYDKPSLYQKLGYLLMLLKDKGKDVPKYIIDKMKKKIKNKLRLIPNPKLKYNYIKEWKIMDNLGKEHILGEIDGT